VPGRAYWPTTADELRELQRALAADAPPPWRPGPGRVAARGCFVCFERGPGARAWAAAAVVRGERVLGRSVITGCAGHGYEAGLLALREGRLLEAAVRALPRRPDVLLVNATGRDHQRRAGLALHLGAVLELPTVGVTHRPLVAEGAWPASERGAHSPLRIGEEIVGCWLRTVPRARPLAVDAAWRTDVELARAVVLACAARVRTPEPLREARRAARTARGPA